MVNETGPNSADTGPSQAGVACTTGLLPRAVLPAGQAQPDQLLRRLRRGDGERRGGGGLTLHRRCHRSVPPLHPHDLRGGTMAARLSGREHRGPTPDRRPRRAGRRPRAPRRPGRPSASRTLTVRRPASWPRCDGLVLPGGESTTMDKLTRAFDLREPLRERLGRGMPAFGIVRRDDPAGRPDRWTAIAGPADARRARHHGAAQRLRPPGRHLRGRPRRRRDLDAVPGARGVHPRALGGAGRGRTSRCSPAWTTGHAAGRIVAVRQGHLLATSFHPEITGGRLRGSTGCSSTGAAAPTDS